MLSHLTVLFFDKFGVSEVIGGPFTVDKQDSYNAGAAKHGDYSAGIMVSDSYNAGAAKAEGAS